MVLSAAAARPVRRRTEPGVIVAKIVVHLLALLPAAWLAWQIRNELVLGTGRLGADPVAAIEHFLGLWALRLLMITLAVTPLRQLTGKAVLLRFRRMLGLYTFFYATVHFAAWMVLDLRMDASQIGAAIAKKPFVTVGFAAWLLLVPLAATSFQRAMRALGRRWGQLHRAIYVIAVLAVLHFWWLVKSDIREPLLYATIAALLLGWRVWKRFAISPRRTATAG
ncbi:sulfoxide reductase heme-binding subunit YedZ [Lysobacter sp. TY2-98]|uniref:protein-methionine-sulfoxide reductase heme-binding subunit MsrQ n=1 Tax=Lysobacter sp. TY2-98 TaxID=2290922 RepID=UPI000E206F50|nr:protein-methionine-sulfoxide reductase heme-binding subunit MsrQ [Lysobacter sp. TY2-98]AXK71679.1 sulfoxide reductase heme-binding subunit YedZ [Lysobacter sp. TY2-98]